MDNLERVMREYLEQGATAEGMAKNFTDTLNKLKKEEEAKRKTNRKVLAADHEDSFRFHCHQKHLDKDDVASLSFLVVVDDHPEWSYEDCQTFIKSIRNNIDITEKMIGKSCGDMVKELFSEVDKAFDDEDVSIVKNFLRDIMGSQGNQGS